MILLINLIVFDKATDKQTKHLFVKIHILSIVLVFFAPHKQLYINFCLVMKLNTFAFQNFQTAKNYIVTSKKMSPFIKAYACGRKTKKLLCCCRSPAVFF